ncbi:sensor histidine kinase [uncultured Hydrogenophaga sp.]|uniref:sensor histidine kinase n=1 Tax=uncultured Hydrogenophaga sp. TaxID=199683 RepID=UPI00265F5B0A|nr:ATP-binding protein [uncultured Hydrogenophaga sp.]
MKLPLLSTAHRGPWPGPKIWLLALTGLLVTMAVTRVLHWRWTVTGGLLDEVVLDVALAAIAIASLSVGAFTQGLGRWVMSQPQPPARNGSVDRTFAALLLVVLAFSLLMRWWSPEQPVIARVSTAIAYQLVQLAACLFLLQSTRVPMPGSLGLAVGQCLLGGLLASLGLVDPSILDNCLAAWRMANALLLGLLFGLLVQHVFRQFDLAGGLVLVVGLIGLGIALNDLLQPDLMLLRIGLTHSMLGVCMFMLWLLVTERVRLPVAAAPPEPAAVADRRVEQERKRLARELHDGVGAHLVNILSGLDRSQPEHQALARALEECLFEVKNVVDVMDASDESVIDGLGQLRFRLRPTLERMGIELAWQVDFEGPLEEVRGEVRHEVLRIAHEALANAIKHAGATRIELTCRFDQEASALLLEVRDDGRGFASTRAVLRGKGVSGMRRRAAGIGGRLRLAADPGHGTQVVLTVPMAPPSQPA